MDIFHMILFTMRRGKAGNGETFLEQIISNNVAMGLDGNC